MGDWLIGKSFTRVDALEKVTGRAVYADDLWMPRMLYAGCVHSSIVRGTAEVDAEEARKMPGVVCVLTEKDFPKPQSGYDIWYCTSHPMYQGDVVAVVAAESEEEMRDALKKVKVRYQRLPAVTSIEEALSPDAPVIREKGVGLTDGVPDPTKKGNVFAESHKPLRRGDADRAMAEADVVFSGTYETGFVEHAYIEPESVLVYRDDLTGAYTARSCSQQGHVPVEFIADALQLPMNHVRSVQCTVGGSFGGKFETVGAMCGRAAVVAMKTGRPCRITYRREESIAESAKRHPFRTSISIGAKKDGTIISYKALQLENCGPYNSQAPWMNIRAMVHSAGPYHIPNIRTDTFGVFTDTLYPCAFRGYSSPQVIFANEMAIDDLADRLGMSPIEVKRKNLLREGDETATGQALTHGVPLVRMMEDMIRDTDYERKDAAWRKETGAVRHGIGLVTSYRGSALGGEGIDASGTMMTALADGSFLVRAALMEMGQGLKTAYTQIAAEASGVAMKDIVLQAVDSSAIADSGLTVASRGTAQGGQSVRKAGESMKRMLRESAAVLLAAGNPEEVEIRDSVCFLKADPSRRVPVSEVCIHRKYAGLPLSVYEWYRPRELVNDTATGQGEAFFNYTYSVAAAELTVNAVTGETRVDRISVSHDVGRAINPDLIRGQIYGGVMMGIGFGLRELVRTDQGKVRDLNFDTYHIARSTDVPEIRIRLYESPDPNGTYGAKGIAEAATETIGAACALAVKHALGKPVTSLPVRI